MHFFPHKVAKREGKIRFFPPAYKRALQEWNVHSPACISAYGDGSMVCNGVSCSLSFAAQGGNKSMRRLTIRQHTHTHARTHTQM